MSSSLIPVPEQDLCGVRYIDGILRDNFRRVWRDLRPMKLGFIGATMRNLIRAHGSSAEPSHLRGLGSMPEPLVRKVYREIRVST